jgi:SAM-dependent methyltransferase
MERMMPPSLQCSASPPSALAEGLCAELAIFREFGRATAQATLRGPGGGAVPVFTNEFWTAKQRAAHPLHEVSYRACFKPQLPRFFIERLTAPGDLVYDPFMGRGTTLIEAALLGRRVAGCDLNPLARVLAAPRLLPPAVGEVAARLASLSLRWDDEVRDDLLVFYHPDTLRELTALRAGLFARFASGEADDLDRWIQMVATNRLTGHSPGFFSVYTLPPNQAVSLDAQRRINRARAQTPPRRDVRALILKKTRRLLADSPSGPRRPPLPAPPLLLTRSCDDTPELRDGCVDLIVTSPPFLDTVDYAADNWLRGWFCGFDLERLPLWRCRELAVWRTAMLRALGEFARVLRPGGMLAFEVGEIRAGTIRLEETVLTAGFETGLAPVCVLINDQHFTKTSNCWGVANRAKGTNTNRVVIFQKSG